MKGIYYGFGLIDHSMASDIFMALESGNLDTIILNSEGGDLCAALAIYDAIVDQNITVVATGTVCSAAMVVLLGGDRRLGTPRCTIVSHPIVSSDCSDDPLVEHLRFVMADIISERTEVTKPRAHRILSKVHVFDFEKAVDEGILHGVWPPAQLELAFDDDEEAA